MCLSDGGFVVSGYDSVDAEIVSTSDFVWNERLPPDKRLTMNGVGLLLVAFRTRIFRRVMAVQPMFN